MLDDVQSLGDQVAGPTPAVRVVRRPLRTAGRAPAALAGHRHFQEEEESMRKTMILVIIVGILASIAGPAHAQGMRIIGVAIAAAGAAMLTVDPEQPVQPTQPGLVPHDTLQDAAVDRIGSLTPRDIRALRGQIGVPVLVCEPFCLGAIDEAILGSFVVGAATGIVTTTEVIESSGWRLYGGSFQPFIPYKERSAGMKYGGAALAVGGAVLAAMWPDQPAMQNLSVTPTRGGARLSKTFGF